MQRLFNFSATITYYLQYVNRFCSGYFILQHWYLITYTLSTCAAAVTSFSSPGLIFPTIYQHVLQRLLHFTALVSYYLDYVNRCFNVYFILQYCSRLIYTMSTCVAAVTSFYRFGLVLPTTCQLVKQRLLHFQQWFRISYNITGAAEVTSFFSTALVLATLSQNMLQRLLQFTSLVSHYLQYVNMSFND
jgi:hypothetical protein